MKEKFFKNIPCPVCGFERSKPIYPINKAYASSRSELDISDVLVNIARCKECGHQFVQPLPQPTFLKAFYSRYIPSARDGFYRNRSRGGIPVAFRRRYGRWLERISLLHENGRTLLDVGAGLGTFLRLARECGYDVFGVEPNPEAAKELQDLYGISVYNCMLEELDASVQYDVVTMWDLLEHLPDPHVAIRKVRDLLKPDGILVLEIPLRDSLIHWMVKVVYNFSLGLIKRPLFLVCGIHHLQYFSKKSIQSFLSVNGFEVAEQYRSETDVRALCKRPRKGLFNRAEVWAYNTGIRGVFLLGNLLGRENKLLIFAKVTEN
jgi:2-polyprenyl-3-methyl-5-hydroxy-6-metoxy-1,4-benzoquinol methylase